MHALTCLTRARAFCSRFLTLTHTHTHTHTVNNSDDNRNRSEFRHFAMLWRQQQQRALCARGYVRARARAPARM